MISACPDCGSPRALRQIGCPDGYEGCLVLHKAAYCPKCDEEKMKIKSAGVTISGGSNAIVIDNNEVYIDGERCYPHGLIEELDKAWQMVLADVDHDRQMKSLERIRRLLGLQ